MRPRVDPTRVSCRHSIQPIRLLVGAVVGLHQPHRPRSILQRRTAGVSADLGVHDSVHVTAHWRASEGLSVSSTSPLVDIIVRFCQFFKALAVPLFAMATRSNDHGV
jgi:hypothetical protein